jgi:hypothetical protein
MVDPKVEKTKKSLISLQTMIESSLDAFQKPRDSAAIKLFFPNLDVALSLVSDVLDGLPKYEYLREDEKLSYGSFLRDFVEGLLIKVKAKMIDASTGIPMIADGSFVIGKTYKIYILGTTDWHAAGVPSDVVPVVGTTFVAIAQGGNGTGFAIPQ